MVTVVVLKPSQKFCGLFPRLLPSFLPSPLLPHVNQGLWRQINTSCGVSQLCAGSVPECPCRPPPHCKLHLTHTSRHRCSLPLSSHSRRPHPPSQSFVLHPLPPHLLLLTPHPHSLSFFLLLSTAIFFHLCSLSPYLTHNIFFVMCSLSPF